MDYFHDYNNYTVTYNYLSMVRLPRENHIIYISLADGNNRYPHDTDHWLSIQGYEDGRLYCHGQVVYFKVLDEIYFSRSYRHVNTYHAANKEHWKFSKNIQDLGILPMVTNTITPPRKRPTSTPPPLDPKGYSIASKEKEIRDEKLKEHSLFLKIKTLYNDAIIVETRKRGYGDTSRIKSRWGKELSIIEEFIVKDKTLPPRTDKALDRVHNELLDYINSAGEWVETTKEYVDISTMIDVMLHPAK